MRKTEVQGAIARALDEVRAVMGAVHGLADLPGLGGRLEAVIGTMAYGKAPEYATRHVRNFADALLDAKIKELIG